MNARPAGWRTSTASRNRLSATTSGVYKATGPHPQVTALIRQLKHEARWLIPGLKGKPNARDGDVRLETDHLRHAAVDLPCG